MDLFIRQTPRYVDYGVAASCSKNTDHNIRQVTNLILNIIGSNKKFNTVDVLRDEISRVRDADAPWTKATLSKMTKADSVARETLRYNSVINRAIFRKVLVDGVVTDAKLPLPKGTIVSFLSYPVHRNDANYEDAMSFDPFRFSKLREREAASATAVKEETEAASRKESGVGAGVSGAAGTGAKLAFVATSPEYMPFGHGRHSCPGRFLVDFEMKMIMAYVLANYDLDFPAEYNGKRPENIWLTEAVMPPNGVKIRLRRRKSAAA